jgi:hypothetical protein
MWQFQTAGYVDSSAIRTVALIFLVLLREE